MFKSKIIVNKFKKRSFYIINISSFFKYHKGRFEEQEKIGTENIFYFEIKKYKILIVFEIKKVPLTLCQKNGII